MPNTAYVNQCIADGAVELYVCNDIAGSTAAASSVAGGVAFPSNAGGTFGNAGSPDGSSTSWAAAGTGSWLGLSLPTTGNVNMNPPSTGEAWVLLAPSQQTPMFPAGPIVVAVENSGAAGFGVTPRTGTQLGTGAPGGTGPFAYLSSAFPSIFDGTWHQIGGTVDTSGRVKMYLDGAKVGDVAFVPQWPPPGAAIGGPFGFFDMTGQGAYLSYYNNVLTPAQMANHYTLMTGKTPQPPRGVPGFAVP